MRRTLTCTLILAAMLLLGTTGFAADAKATANVNRLDIGLVTGVTTISAMTMMSVNQVGDPEVSAAARPDIAANLANSAITMMTISTTAGVNDATLTKRVSGGEGAYNVILPTASSINNSIIGTRANNNAATTNVARTGGANARSSPTMTASFSNTAVDNAALKTVIFTVTDAAEAKTTPLKE